MLIHRIEKTHFSPSETVIIDYILKKGLEIKNMTISQIAQHTYTSAPLLVRIAKKLGYDGWNEFKEDYLKELEYLYYNNTKELSKEILKLKKLKLLGIDHKTILPKNIKSSLYNLDIIKIY